MKALVLGGTGFIGRYVVRSMKRNGVDVTIGTRRKPLSYKGEIDFLEISLHHSPSLFPLTNIVKNYDVVVNCVGILRPRFQESYDAVHHLAPAALARACAETDVRFIHVSALGLSADAASGFLRSKHAGEAAIVKSGADYSIVRPSVLDGKDGFGSRWIRRVANWPIHLVPRDAKGLLAPLAVEDLGEAIASLAEIKADDRFRVVELGGANEIAMADYLRALRNPALPAAPVVRIPAWIVRLASHVCDVLHFSPLSWAHVLLLRRDNRPAKNLLPLLIARPPRNLGLFAVDSCGNGLRLNVSCECAIAATTATESAIL